MLSSRWAKVISDILSNKTRTVLIVLSIAVGLFAVGTILSSRAILATEMDKSYARINPSSGIIRTMESFDDDFVVSMRHTPGVADADARRTVLVRARVSPEKWLDLKVFAVSDFQEMRVNKIFPQSGAFPPPKRQILIERSALGLLNVSTGDNLLIETPDEKRVWLPVAGVVHDMVQVPASFDGTPYGYISFDTLEYLGEPQSYNELAIVALKPNDEKYAQEVVSRVKDKAEKAGYTIPLSMSAEAGQLPLDDILQTILLILGVLGVLSLFLSVFLIINTFSALIVQQMRQIGVMKAVGADNSQIISMYLGMVLVYSVLALLLAVPLGILGAQALSAMMAGMFNFDLENVRIPLEAIVIQIVIGLLVPLAAAFYPLLTNLRGTSAEAMNSVTLGKSAKIDFFDRILSGSNLWITRLWLVRTWLLSLRNTFRNKGRLALTLLTLTLAGGIFISVFTVQASLMNTMDDLLKMWGYDVMMTFRRPYRVAHLQEEARQVRGVKSTDIWLQFPARRIRSDGSESGLIYMFAPPPDSAVVQSPLIVKGRWLLDQDEYALVVNTNFIKDESDVGVGDEVILKVNGDEKRWKIVGTSLGFGAPMIYANYAYVAQDTGSVGRASTLLVFGEDHSRPAVAVLSVALENHFKKAGLQVSSMQTMTEERAEMETNFSVLIVLLLIMAVLLAVVGGLGLMGTMSINVIERTREIGVLRAIGASNKSVSLVFVREGVFIGLLSWLMGTFLAVPLGKLISDGVGSTLMGVPLSYKYSLDGVWMWLLLVLILSLFASVLPARNASRLTVREVLAYE